MPITGNAQPFNREQPPSNKRTKPKKKEWHVANTKYGMGDNYGTGLKAKVGKSNGGYSPISNPATPKQLKKPPKSLA